MTKELLNKRHFVSHGFYFLFRGCPLSNVFKPDDILTDVSVMTDRFSKEIVRLPTRLHGQKFDKTKSRL